jgi:hypothetical protein
MYQTGTRALAEPGEELQGVRTHNGLALARGHLLGAHLRKPLACPP